MVWNPEAGAVLNICVELAGFAGDVVTPSSSTYALIPETVPDSSPGLQLAKGSLVVKVTVISPAPSQEALQLAVTGLLQSKSVVAEYAVHPVVLPQASCNCAAVFRRPSTA